MDVTAFIEQTRILLDSYRHWTGRELIARHGSPEEQARALFEAPFVVVSHGTQADPILNYGNRTALSLWEMELPTLLQTPSRLTAEPVHRDERARLLERTTRDGYVDDYQGIRAARRPRLRHRRTSSRATVLGACRGRTSIERAVAHISPSASPESARHLFHRAE